MILCGGRGTRLQERTQEIPKPLVEIGGLPILWHVIQLYAVQGFRRFVLATGYKGEMIERFAATHEWPAGVEVQCVDTGPQTPLGGASSCWRSTCGDSSPSWSAAASAPPTPTEWRTSTSPAPWISRRPWRPGDA